MSQRALSDEQFQDEGWGTLPSRYRAPSAKEVTLEAFHLQRIAESEREEQDWKGNASEERIARANGYKRSNITEFTHHGRQQQQP